MKKLALIVALAVGAGSAGAFPLFHKHHKAQKKQAPAKKK